MLPTPQRVKLVAGAAEGGTKLTAFDRALLAAGIGNLNLIRVSSILPPDCALEADFAIPPGSLTPTAYGALTCDEPGRLVTAAIGVGTCLDGYGVIMEFSGFCGREEAEAQVSAMVREAFAVREKALAEVHVRSASIVVERIAAVVAAAVLWY